MMLALQPLATMGHVWPPGKRGSEEEKRFSHFPFLILWEEGGCIVHRKATKRWRRVIKESDCIKPSWDGLYIPTLLVLVDPN